MLTGVVLGRIGSFREDSSTFLLIRCNVTAVIGQLPNVASAGRPFPTKFNLAILRASLDQETACVVAACLVRTLGDADRLYSTYCGLRREYEAADDLHVVTSHAGS